MPNHEDFPEFNNDLIAEADRISYDLDAEIKQFYDSLPADLTPISHDAIAESEVPEISKPEAIPIAEKNTRFNKLVKVEAFIGTTAMASGIAIEIAHGGYDYGGIMLAWAGASMTFYAIMHKIASK